VRFLKKDGETLTETILHIALKFPDNLACFGGAEVHTNFVPCLQSGHNESE